MIGMLPGVECARRRRLHQSGGCMAINNSTRRSFSLYSPSNMESLLSSASSSLLQRSILNQTCPDDRAAREAKQRLDDRFNAHRKSESCQRHNHNHNQKRKSLFHGFCLQLRSYST